MKENNTEESSSEIIYVKEDCMSMLEEALNQVSNRLPAARDTFKNLSNLSPFIILNQVSRVPFTQLPFLLLIENNICIIEDQYRKIINIDWREEPPFKN